MNDQYKLKLGLEWWEDQTEDPIWKYEGPAYGPHLSDWWRWKAMQASIAAYGPTAEAVEWLGKALSRELKNGGKTLKAIEEIGKIGPNIWSPEFHIERIYGRGLSYYNVKTPVFVGDGILRMMAAQNPEELREFLTESQYRVLKRIIGKAGEALQTIGERPDVIIQEEQRIAEQVAKARFGEEGEEMTAKEKLVSWGILAMVIFLVVIIPILCTC